MDSENINKICFSGVKLLKSYNTNKTISQFTEENFLYLKRNKKKTLKKQTKPLNQSN